MTDETCERCKGQGIIPPVPETGEEAEKQPMQSFMAETCPDCKGTGRRADGP